MSERYRCIVLAEFVDRDLTMFCHALFRDDI